MSVELDVATGDALTGLSKARPKHWPGAGAPCTNCATPLEGPYCHACGQNADNHKRSLLHLGWEMFEDMFHLDGRLLRTGPDLFIRPGRLAKDYLEGRVARHVPPFRTFLVALLVFVFAAEHAIHTANRRNEEQMARRVAALATPQGRLAEATKRRQEAASERDGSFKEAADDRNEELTDHAENRARIETRYAAALMEANTEYAKSLTEADGIAAGTLNPIALEKTSSISANVHSKSQGLEAGFLKARDNPEYFFTVMFEWGHRLAVLLLPIVSLCLALAYRNRPKYFIHDHAITAMNLLSFSFLANAAGLIMPTVIMPWWLGAVAFWTPVNLFQTLRGAYGSSVPGAMIKTAWVWCATTLAFGALLVAIILVTLNQL